MNAFYKAIFFLGIAAMLLAVPMTAAADDGIQDSPTVALAAAGTSISFHARTTAQAQVSAGAVVFAAGPASLRHAPVRSAKFSPQDGRATLQSICLLRC